MSKKHLKIKWLDEPAKHDYTAAESYLSLLFDSATAARARQETPARPHV